MKVSGYCGPICGLIWVKTHHLRTQAVQYYVHTVQYYVQTVQYYVMSTPLNSL